MADRYFLQTIWGTKTPCPRAMRGQYTVAHALPEGVDLSEGGWATDFAASLVAALMLVQSLLDSNGTDSEWQWMYGGTMGAHLFGGLAHRYYPNRAMEGVGNYGFYVCMMLGYSSNCLRYGFGWSLGNVWQYIALGNIVYMILSGILVMCTMKPTTLIIDNVPQGNRIFWADRWFGFGEAVVSVMEVVSCLYYGYTSVADDAWNGYLITAIVANVAGWFFVYFFALLYLRTGIDYDPSLMQRLFHFCMIIMLWALHASSVLQSNDSQGGDANNN